MQIIFSNQRVFLEYIKLFTHLIFIMILGWYLITNLQWYNYKLSRVIFKHHKQKWHLLYFVFPIILYYLQNDIAFYLYFYLVHIGIFVLWNYKLDRPLVITSRTIRFLSILMFSTFVLDAFYVLNANYDFRILEPLAFTLAVTAVLEKILFLRYKKQAKDKLFRMPDLKIIAITASFGKTSIKNYLYQVLSKSYNVYMTPRSVNTIGGIVKDINENLNLDCQIYIVEAGARQKGDIEEISKLLEHHYAIIGSVGNQHIEYFKTLENIVDAKIEILKTPNLIHGFLHESVPVLKYGTTRFPSKLKITKSDLDGIWFSVKVGDTIESFNAPILGRFNATNLTAVILMAYELGMSIDKIRNTLSCLKPTKHRLQLTNTGGKLILDDSFNGNLDGMLEAINISSTFDGRKVIVTPGLIESTTKANKELAKAIDKVFDLVIITGSLNSKVLKKNIHKAEVILSQDKSDLQDILLENTEIGDLILFANDAPNFI